MTTKKNTQKTKTAPDQTLSGITLDLAQRIYEKALERAEKRKETLLEKIMEILNLEYFQIDEKTGKEILAALLEKDRLSETLIRAEITRMNSTIAFLAQDKNNPTGKD